MGERRFHGFGVVGILVERLMEESREVNLREGRF